MRLQSSKPARVWKARHGLSLQPGPAECCEAEDVCSGAHLTPSRELPVQTSRGSAWPDAPWHSMEPMGFFLGPLPSSSGLEQELRLLPESWRSYLHGYTPPEKSRSLQTRQKCLAWLLWIILLWLGSCRTGISSLCCSPRAGGWGRAPQALKA